MKALVIGAGGVGSAIANIASRRSFISSMVIADRTLSRAIAAVTKVNNPSFSAEEVDASDVNSVRALIRKAAPDIVINAVDPRFVMPIFLACEEEKVNYIDMAMSLSTPHPTEPTSKPGVKLGDEQFARASQWEQNQRFALVGMGIEPGMSDVFARYAADELFSRIDYLAVMDGSNLTVDGYDFAPSFSIWTTIEECLNPPLIWDADRGWYTTEPFSELETFNFPDGIGPVECVNVEHEEVVLIPQKVKAKEVRFKYGLGAQFIETLKTIHTLGMDKKEKVTVGNVEISPRDLLASLLPDPATIGDLMHGKTCAGTLVKGLDKSGAPKAVYIYNVVDNEWSMKNYGNQAVVWQTAINPLIAMELIHTGQWKPAGVCGPEWFPAQPFLDLIHEYGSSWHIREEDPKGISQ
jgi:saccharopine dehydrogenase-like NADP-dependent oxidoreductase